ncbi:MutS-related protein [Enterococcus casseliflavus]|uniref:MutS-related protein n=1 Tax=Enterococcus casseliflavus TaxID=37734 RepID=UPI002DB9FD86|nr:DNA mismatch repair protein MutS [Enterococcus casseliflavus]MEB6147786.1 DNA mismatch repair protein MutS [Enterococcus casseliflavus]
MEPQTMVILIILASILILTALDIWNRYKVRRYVRLAWGKLPHQPRFDKEASLKKAWLTEKKFHDFDSEIDDITWYDLDGFSLFESINLTFSSVGSEALYQQLRNFRFKTDKQLTKLIDFFATDSAAREQSQYTFARLGKQDDNFSKAYLANEAAQSIGSLPFFVFLGVLPLVGILLLLLGFVQGILLTLVSVVFNTIYYSIKKAKLETELNSMRYLVQTIACGSQIAKINTPLQDEIKQSLAPLKKITRFAFSFRAKNGSEGDMLFEYINIIFMLPFISYQTVTTTLAKHQQAAIDLWNLLGKLEVAAAILNFRTYMPITCLPTFQTSGGVQATGTYHPLLSEAVMNDVAWTHNTLVTGSNASGKSTYVKSIAINCILAQTIQTAVAETFTMVPGHVITSMAVEDDLFEGDSYFVAEIKSIKRLLDTVATNQRCYCFVDEILKGTNTVERIAASASIIHWLRAYPSLAFVATHDIELTEILKNDCRNIHFSEQVTEDDGISFDYKVKSGPALSRNAIALLKVMGYPETIVQDAYAAANDFDQNRKWQDL